MDAFTYNPLDYAQYPTQGTQFGAPGNVNREFFGEKGSNWKDSTKFAYEQLAQREANAFDIAVMNYKNKYDSPLEQMKRNMEAGINPYAQGAISSQPSAQAPASGAARGSASHAQVTAQKLNFAQNMIGQVFDIVSGVAGIKKQLQQIKYNDEAFPIMINRLRYQAGNESLRSFINELGINAGTISLAKQAYEAGIPLNYLPWFTHGPQVYGSSIGFDFDNLDNFQKFLNESPTAQAFTELINLRKRQGGNILANAALAKSLKKLTEAKEATEETKKQKEAIEALLKEWELNAKDITGNETLDKLIWTLFN